MTEQPIESIHHRLNVDLAKCNNVRDKEVIFERLTSNCCVRNAVFDENLNIMILPEKDTLIAEEEFAEFEEM
jgi:hypothetical protein